jgi:hypothetical protein
MKEDSEKTVSIFVFNRILLKTSFKNQYFLIDLKSLKSCFKQFFGYK